MEAATGPNRLAEAIYRSGRLLRGPTLLEPRENLARLLKDLRMECREPSWNWRRAASSDGLASDKVWDQLARSWAAETVEDPTAVMTDSERAELAARCQMVTPFPGAVVLETQQQYDEHGLTPADGSATPRIPSVPEPSSGLLAMLAAAALLRRRRESSQDYIVRNQNLPSRTGGCHSTRHSNKIRTGWQRADCPRHGYQIRRAPGASP